MITVLCGPAGPHADALIQTGPAGPYKFVAASPRPHVRLEFTDRGLPAPFAVRADGAVLITTRLSHELARYAGLSVSDYVRTMALCGIVQSRTLQVNPDQRIEFFRHRCAGNC